MHPFILPIAALLGGFAFLADKKDQPPQGQANAFTATLPSGIRAFRPEARASFLNAMARRGVIAEAIQGQQAPLFRAVPYEQGAISMAQTIVTAEGRGLCAVASSDPSGEVYVLFVRPQDVPSVTGPTSTLALLTLSRPKQAVGQAPAAPPSAPAEPALDATLAEGLERALSDENVSADDLRALAKGFADHPSAALRIEKRAKDLDLRKQLANLQQKAPEKKSKKATNGAANHSLVTETLTDGAQSPEADA